MLSTAGHLWRHAPLVMEDWVAACLSHELTHISLSWTACSEAGCFLL